MLIRSRRPPTEQHRRNFKTKNPCRLELDNEFKLGRLLDREVSGLVALRQIPPFSAATTCGRSLPQSGFCAASSQLDVLVTPSEAGSVLQLLEGSSMRAHTKDRDYARPASGIGPPKWTGGQNRERDRDKRSSGADQVRPSA
jgi:hypothetical protein